ncbi:hypothetical protein LGR54_22875 [Ancylobacter sp. Lp-2]|uniref:hypothetical protein n=1 Tax=Ancylobacter sp. Lp-2 TaxID=2881339 RepID=UPI001E3C699A|nr:hypothetical protein [Ancylobacter sp. Lp-2]MCB4771457.1 hypothetical protein [Ancylobacter sp. Lp-2]
MSVKGIWCLRRWHRDLLAFVCANKDANEFGECQRAAASLKLSATSGFSRDFELQRATLSGKMVPRDGANVLKNNVF